MTLPASGPISMAQIAAELGIGATGINLNMANVRALGGGATDLNSFHGKSNLAPLIISCPDVIKTPVSGGTQTVSVTANAVASGGSGGYTYSTTYVSGDASFNGANLASATPRFSKSCAVGSSFTAIYKITVIDNGGRTAFANFAVTLEGVPV